MKGLFPESLGQKHECSLYTGMHDTGQNAVSVKQQSDVLSGLLPFYHTCSQIFSSFSTQSLRQR